MGLEKTSSVDTVSPVEAVLSEVDESRSGLSRSSVRRFAIHLGEMLLAMLAGMTALIVAIVAFGEAPGFSSLFVEYAVMGAAMAVPMVAWMRYRGHSWRDGWEMSTSMFVPMYVLVVPVALEVGIPGLTQDSLMLLAHVAMIGGMVALMVLRWERYTCAGHIRSNDG